MTLRSRAACFALLAMSLAGCGLFSSRPSKRAAEAEPAPTRVEVKTETALPAVPPLPSTSQPAVGPSLSVGPVRPVETAQAPAAPAPMPDVQERRPMPRAGGEQTAPRGGSPERLIVFNFDNADIEVVIQAAA